MIQTKQEWKIGNCLELLSEISNNSIDLTITSPPYDNIRDYGGYIFNFELIAQELYRVTKNGGVIIWVVGDQTINGNESGTSFKQALYFKEIGFNLHDTMIYMKNGISFPDSNRYQQCFEYMFVFSKGGAPKTIHLISDRENINYGRKIHGTDRQKDGSTIRCHGYNKSVKKFGVRWNIWQYNNTKLNGHINHPAPFPENLVKDHILSWSNEGDIILDPFLGSGTTLKMCYETNRNGIGFEINPKYEIVIKERLLFNQIRFI